MQQRTPLSLLWAIMLLPSLAFAWGYHGPQRLVLRHRIHQFAAPLEGA